MDGRHTGLPLLPTASGVPMLHDLSRRLQRLLNDAPRSNTGQRQAALPERSVIRLRYPAIRTGDRTSQDWQLRLLIGQGARMHTTSVERGDGCSIAILDTHGRVVAWHDTLPGAKTLDPGVAGAHVSQFYLPHDVAFGRPGRGLMAACLHGSDTQQRWHRRPDGSILWAYTVIEAMRLGNGELNGYSHVTRFAQDPHARAVADARCVAGRYSVCHGAVAVA